MSKLSKREMETLLNPACQPLTAWQEAAVRNLAHYAAAPRAQIVIKHGAPKPEGEPKPKLLTKREAAVYLRISMRTLERMVARREITPVRIGDRPLFPRALLESIHNSNKKVYSTSLVPKTEGDEE